MLSISGSSVVSIVLFINYSAAAITNGNANNGSYVYMWCQSIDSVNIKFTLAI